MGRAVNLPRKKITPSKRSQRRGTEPCCLASAWPLNSCGQLRSNKQVHQVPPGNRSFHRTRHSALHSSTHLRLAHLGAHSSSLHLATRLPTLQKALKKRLPTEHSTCLISRHGQFVQLCSLLGIGRRHANAYCSHSRDPRPSSEYLPPSPCWRTSPISLS